MARPGSWARPGRRAPAGLPDWAAEEGPIGETDDAAAPRAGGAPCATPGGPFARVAVLGTTGAGKTVLAARLAAILEAPHVELDALHWGPEWTGTPTPVFRTRVAGALAAPRWVCDGNYGAVRDLVLDRATAVVWLDYGLPTVFGRALCRTVRRGLTGEPLWAGNRESLRRGFLSRDSILLWVLTTWRRRRREYAALFAGDALAGLRKVRLRRPRDAERLCRALERGVDPGAW